MIALLLAATVGNGPVDFGAETLRMEPKDRRAILDGKVHLRQDDLSLTGQHAVADFRAEDQRARKPAKLRSAASALGKSIRRFEVQGAVHVARGNRSADADHGILDSDAGTLILTGTEAKPPVLRDGSETLSGERIVLRLDSEDVDVLRPKITLRRSMVEEGQAGKKPAPVRIEAAKLFLDRERRVARFSDDVVVRQADTTVRSPRMDARYDADGQLTELKLRGGVDLRQGERRATGENADYDARTRELVFTGDPRVYDRGDVLAGDRIDLSLESKEVRVERARGSFRPNLHDGEKAR